MTVIEHVNKEIFMKKILLSGIFVVSAVLYAQEGLEQNYQNKGSNAQLQYPSSYYNETNTNYSEPCVLPLNTGDNTLQEDHYKVNHAAQDRCVDNPETCNCLNHKQGYFSEQETVRGDKCVPVQVYQVNEEHEWRESDIDYAPYWCQPKPAQKAVDYSESHHR